MTEVVYSRSSHCGGELGQALPTSRPRTEAKLEKGGRATLERAWLLLEFACALERGLAVACEGCAAAPQPGASVAAFFSIPKNQKVHYRCFFSWISSTPSPKEFGQEWQLGLQNYASYLAAQMG